MSKEGPKAPLWPEGISKVRPVGKQKTEALPKGASAPVAKQPELSKPGEQIQPNPKERQASERLGKPPPVEEASPTTQRITLERIQEVLKRRPTLTEEDAKMLLALEDEVADIKRRGFRGFIFP